MDCAIYFGVLGVPFFFFFEQNWLDSIPGFPCEALQTTPLKSRATSVVEAEDTLFFGFSVLQSFRGRFSQKMVIMGGEYGKLGA